MSGNTATNTYRIAAALALATGAVQVWMNVAVGIVGSEENPTNMGFFMVVAGAAACAFTARFTPGGMARAMVAAAGLQALVGLAVATAPVNAAESVKVLALSGGFVALWLLTATLFHRSAAPDRGYRTA